ncbi:DUF4212 domain-containing protein [Alteromonas sp. KS69]|jgi:putative solute:sodium symporter small subunit|uniref:Sodium symporter small subunit domain-containing protein n=1 Tax=Alteromonas naphthalenivorans TaxID=715451 RepID=F5ZA11_ALTNA|nr:MULTISPECIES: DUF4212 domain-containing protein [Alteromonas]PHS48185.1 MAG: DUF4212 domain-containing protein [Alteromonas sp.]AEF01625.1 hypothetical protein ambt_00315 [Alteromonas naphthalenivorans]MBO7923888.1 DUF4212 domain-containing protein [Alteromonas sp. K632G]MCQ8850327.1 DUF4212 domain-containing protein [Alteromonas stellipolaris]RUP80051.1 DUF4212 domain-containing protein [Alteromonas sp. KS69]|tara:strand:+ start:6022 stop:6288 length:267 start_codon:yes stop_codon:yes gene_type:complete
MAFRNDDDKKAYWKENLSLLAKLLIVWFAVSFGAGILFVDVLDNIHFFGFKLGFWFAQQGSIYVFVALIFVYMSKMKAMDKRYGVNEE